MFKKKTVQNYEMLFAPGPCDSPPEKATVYSALEASPWSNTQSIVKVIIFKGMLQQHN